VSLDKRERDVWYAAFQASRLNFRWGVAVGLLVLSSNPWHLRSRDILLRSSGRALGRQAGSDELVSPIYQSGFFGLLPSHARTLADDVVTYFAGVMQLCEI
jgi:hypothetical protein